MRNNQWRWHIYFFTININIKTRLVTNEQMSHRLKKANKQTNKVAQKRSRTQTRRQKHKWAEPWDVDANWNSLVNNVTVDRAEITRPQHCFPHGIAIFFYFFFFTGALWEIHKTTKRFHLGIAGSWEGEKGRGLMLGWVWRYKAVLVWCVIPSPPKKSLPCPSRPVPKTSRPLPVPPRGGAGTIDLSDTIEVHRKQTVWHILLKCREGQQKCNNNKTHDLGRKQWLTAVASEIFLHWLREMVLME